MQVGVSRVCVRCAICVVMANRLTCAIIGLEPLFLGEEGFNVDLNILYLADSAPALGQDLASFEFLLLGPI